MSFGALAFLSPMLLTALLALPVIYWLLRTAPPRPRRFPANHPSSDSSRSQASGGGASPDDSVSGTIIQLSDNPKRATTRPGARS